MTRRDATCPKCGGAMYRYAKTCTACKNQGAANHMFGRTHTPEARAKIAAAQMAREQRPRKTGHVRGHDFARRWFPMPDLCERCGSVPPRDRHHKDANPRNNNRANIAFLCRRCHQEVDGRMDWLTMPGQVGTKPPMRGLGGAA